jgi:vacuolar protein sorting-associated protein 35
MALLSQNLFTNQTFVELVKLPELSFRLLLNCALSASETGFQAVAYQFIEKAYTIYEQDITDSIAQFNAMNLLIPTLATLRLTEDDSMTLLAKTAQHCSRVLKKTDQCVLVSLVSHLFQVRGRRGLLLLLLSVVV